VPSRFPHEALPVGAAASEGTGRVRGWRLLSAELSQRVVPSTKSGLLVEKWVKKTAFEKH